MDWHACSILPAYILRAIASELSTDKETRQHVESALKLTAEVQAGRQFSSDVPDSTEVSALQTGSGKPHRTIYDMHSTTDYTKATLRRSEGQAEDQTDKNVNICYNNLGAIHKFLFDILHRDSIDNHGQEIAVYLHYGNHWPQAMWIKDRKVMIVGDGFTGDTTSASTLPPSSSIRYFGNFATSLDTIAHELCHGIIHATARFEYNGQSGALAESICDVFASMAKQYTLGQTVSEADWLIGQDTFLPHYPEMGMRSLKQPGKAFSVPDPTGGKDPLFTDKQVSNMTQYEAKSEHDDHGGVHIYSGIPNHAFYVAATQIGGHSWEKAGMIWFNALTRGQLSPSASFQDFAQVTMKMAHEFGDETEQAVRSAWSSVGITT